MSKNVFKSAIMLTFFTLLSRLSGFVRDILFAQYLGSGLIADAFFAAFKLPNTFRRIFGEGALASAFVPIFSQEIKNNKKQALQFAGATFNLLFITLLVILIVAEYNMKYIVDIINPGFVKNIIKFELSTTLSKIAFVYLIFISLIAFLGSILNSINIFWYFAITPVIMNFVMIFGALYFKKYFQNIGYCLSYMLVVTGIIQIIFLFYGCYRNKVLPNIFHPLIDNKIKLMFHRIVPSVVSGGVFQINIFIDTIFASFFPGAISYLYYTDRIGQLPLSLIGYSLSTVILPALSVALKKKVTKEALLLQNKSINLSLLFTIPSTLIILFFSEEIVYVVYKGGNFDDNDIIIVAKMLLIYTIALPFNVIYKIFLSCLFANGNTKSSMYISIVGLIVNVVLNFCFISIFKEFSVVFATTISSIVSFLLAIYWLKKINFLSLNMDNLKFLIKIILKSIIMCLIVKLCLICLLKINILSKLHSFNILLSFFIGGVFYLLINYKDIITIKDN